MRNKKVITRHDCPYVFNAYMWRLAWVIAFIIPTMLLICIVGPFFLIERASYLVNIASRKLFEGVIYIYLYKLNVKGAASFFRKKYKDNKNLAKKINSFDI